MKFVSYLLVGIFFGIVMFKSEAASWFRIYEMFKFDSFHMYGIIGSALVLGIIFVQIIKRKNVNSVNGKPITINDKDLGFKRYFIGGTIFGLGWALCGACPGPMYTLIGVGYISIIIVVIAAILGTFVYGLLRERLPH